MYSKMYFTYINDDDNKCNATECITISGLCLYVCGVCALECLMMGQKGRPNGISCSHSEVE